MQSVVMEDGEEDSTMFAVVEEVSSLDAVGAVPVGLVGSSLSPPIPPRPCLADDSSDVDGVGIKMFLANDGVTCK